MQPLHISQGPTRAGLPASPFPYCMNESFWMTEFSFQYIQFLTEGRVVPDEHEADFFVRTIR
jgi:hypothetical protein